MCLALLFNTELALAWLPNLFLTVNDRLLNWLSLGGILTEGFVRELGITVLLRSLCSFVFYVPAQLSQDMIGSPQLLGPHLFSAVDGL